MATSRALTLLPVLLLLAGCGAGRQPLVASAVNGQVTAQGVTPDADAIFAGDLRRAAYWNGDAELIVSIQTTALNTQALSAAANVFYSKEAYYDGSKPCVFVARHYMSKNVSQYTVESSLSDMSNGRIFKTLEGVGAYTVKAAEAWNLARSFQPAQPATACPVNVTCPPPAPAPKAFFPTSRAMLFKTIKGSTDPAWWLYADHKKYVINANTKEVSAPVPQLDPNDRLNEGFEVDIQRASTAWLPINPMTPIQHDPPSGSN